MGFHVVDGDSPTAGSAGDLGEVDAVLAGVPAGGRAGGNNAPVGDHARTAVAGGAGRHLRGGGLGLGFGLRDGRRRWRSRKRLGGAGPTQDGEHRPDVDLIALLDADFFDLPVKDGEVQPAIAVKWIANSPLAMVDQYMTNLKKYHAIAGDCGLQDGLVGSNKDLDASFTRLGIVHTFETYEGDHTNHVKERFEGSVLPFFSSNLTFTQAKR